MDDVPLTPIEFGDFPVAASAPCDILGTITGVAALEAAINYIFAYHILILYIEWFI